MARPRRPGRNTEALSFRQFRRFRHVINTDRVFDTHTGAADFLEKPIRGIELLAGVGRALESSHDSGKLTEWRKDAADHLACLTRRQLQMEMVLAGHPSKNIAADL